jgi:hypothetical protein
VPTDAQRDAYRDALKAAGVPFTELAPDQRGLVLTRIPFRAATLVIAINESSRAQTVSVDAANHTLPPGEAHYFLLDRDGKLVSDL